MVRLTVKPDPAHVREILHVTAVTERGGGGYVSRCPEVGVMSHGSTETIARNRLVLAVAETLADVPLDELQARLKRLG